MKHARAELLSSWGMGASDRTLRGSWKLTFIAWSGLLLIWSIVTVALDEDSLRLLRRLGVERSDVAVPIIALVIGLPLAVDMTRNLQRTYRIWKRRAATQTPEADWNRSSPPTCRGASNTREDPS